MTDKNGVPVVNGKTAEVVVKGTVALLALLIVAITVIAVRGQPTPETLVSMASLLVGVLVGSRVVQPSVADAVKQKDALK